MSSAHIDPKSSARAFYAVQLKQIRTARKMTQPEVGQLPEVMVSGKLIGHIETLYRAPTRRLSRGLDKGFGLPELFEASYEAIKRESGIPSHFWEYAELEARAGSVKTYQNFLVMGLFQIEDYAREVLRAGRKPDKIEELVSTRLERQQILHREDPPWLTALFDESIIRRVVGGREVMRHQLQHLLTMMQEPTITIRIVPDTAAVYPSGAFNLLELPEESDVAYVEAAEGHGQLIESSSQIHALGVTFDQVGSVALPVTDSEKLIRAVMESL